MNEDLSTIFEKLDNLISEIVLIQEDLRRLLEKEISKEEDMLF